MKTLTFEQMEVVNGGATARQCEVIGWIGYAAGIASLFGGVAGALIFGPTAIAMGLVDNLIC
ncbi:MAG: hypothetical protein LBC89_04305 [Bacteroidales bacterium]|jgi:hypothetical protein|nr:hypothetical protein [Bacteroidales bacterium]